MFGQYAAGGGMDRTKADMVACFEGIASARKGGKNRLIATFADGSKGFSLHETMVVRLSADGHQVTLNDGGWATPTTRTAFAQGLAAFGVQGAHVWGAKGGHILRLNGQSIRFDRTVTVDLRTGQVVSGGSDCPLIRATVDGGNFEVRYQDGRLVSTAGADIPCTPKRVLVALYWLDEMARRNKGRFCFRSEVLWDTARTLLGHEVLVGSGARTLHIGCHVFKTVDVRVAMRRIADENPEAAKAARKAFLAERRAEVRDQAEAA